MGILETTGIATSQPGGTAWAAPAGEKVSKEGLAQKAGPLTSFEFARRHLAPLVNGPLSTPTSGFHAEIEQNTGTGRLTLRYVLNPETILHAKLYTDELGPRCYAVMKALWEDGFGAGSAFQVPEPIGFLVDYNLLVMRQAPGTCLAEALRGDPFMDLVEGSRNAAHWLSALHRSRLRLGTPEAEWVSLKLFNTSARLIKAAAAQPDQLDQIRDLLEQIEQRIHKMPRHRPLVQTHGRYHHDHVFVSSGITTVIDLDRSCPSDPGKDLAEFVHVLRLAAFKRGLDWRQVDDSTRTFLREYLNQMPEVAPGFSCHWAAFMFHDLLGQLKKDATRRKENWRELLDFSIREVHSALEVGP
jgi:hypothetical protein